MKKLLFILSILLVSNLFADIAKIVALKGEAAPADSFGHLARSIRTV